MFETHHLPNGGRIVTAVMRDAPSTAVFIGVAAGSRYETPAAAGIAHFAEHMFFKGTERRPTAHAIASEIDGFGGDFNAFTSKEMTAYHVKCAADSASIALDVLGDMFLHSLFDAAEIEREKGVIVEEINMYADQPRSRVDELFDTTRFGGTPIGRPIIGSKETVRAATRETFTDYLDTWYRTERVVIGLAGSVSEALVEQARELLASVPGGATPERPVTTLPELTAPVVAIDRRDSDQAHLMLGVDGLPIAHEDRYVLALLQTILGSGMSSRLFTEVRERRGLAYYVYAGQEALTDVGSLIVSAGVDIKRLELAVETIWAELRRIADEPVGLDELDKARRFQRGRTVLGVEDPRGMIMFGLRRSLLEGQTAELADIFAALDRVTAEDIQRVAETLIRADRTTLAITGPVDDPEPLRAVLEV